MRPRRPQPLTVRLLHWGLVPVLIVMAMSGLQILAAYPYLGPRGELWSLYPLQGASPPAPFRLGEWLAGARHWHFAFAWPFSLFGLGYLGWLGVTGEWRRRLFLPRRDLRSAFEVTLAYARLRRVARSDELYNGLQRLAYTVALLALVVSAATGLVLYKPVQLAWLGALTGGYEGARAAHLLALFVLAAFLVGHVLMALLHPRSLGEMITGGKRNG